ncbi:MAG: response regulator transcription factor [Caldilineaceae bacterium]
MIEADPVILLVDDSPANVHLLVQSLTQEHFKVLVAENGASALESVRYALPDIILLDVVMPGMDGFVTCQRLKENPATRDIPVIFLTALDEAVDKVRGFRVGGVDYITKPLQTTEVVARVRTHLSLRELRQALEVQNEQLEDRVLERTVQLQEEVERRKQNESEKHKLLDILGKQSDQLRDLTAWAMERNQQRHTGLADAMMTQAQHSFRLVGNHLDILDTLAGTIDNSTDRYQFTVQLHALRDTLAQLEKSLRSSMIEMKQPAAEIQEALNNPLLKLTAREREILQLFVDGKSNTAIAELLYLSETTVRTHRSRIMQKLGLEDAVALIKFAVKHNLTAI